MSNREQVLDQVFVAEAELSSNKQLRRVRLQNFEAPFFLNVTERDTYLRRFTTLFLDEETMRTGASGSVMRAHNSLGEVLALKVFETPDVFQSEYSIMQQLSGLKGFPRVYGQGLLNDKPAVVMEWIEGETLERARGRIALDDAGHLSPLAVARIGRDLFDVLSRMDALQESIAHADLSSNNIMIGTSRMSLEEQTEDGAFDIRLIDFGSARRDTGLADTDNSHKQRTGTTPGFAAPEVKQGGSALKSADVYSAAAVLYYLLCGILPQGEDNSLTFTTAHGQSNDVASVLLHEPEVAVAVGSAASTLSPKPSTTQVADALNLVDTQLEDILRACLVVDPNARPQANEVRDALAAFSDNYAENISRALQGEPLIPCSSHVFAKGLASLSAQARTRLRIIGKAVSGAIGAVTILATSILLNNAGANLSLGDGATLSASGWMIALVLLLPASFGCLAHIGSRTQTPKQTFTFSTIGVIVGALLALIIGLLVPFTLLAASHLALVALLLSTACSWCIVVLDYVIAPSQTKIDKGLPAATSAARATESEGVQELNSSQSSEDSTNTKERA